MKSFLKYLIKKRFPVYLSAFVIFLILFFSINNVPNMLRETNSENGKIYIVSSAIFLVYIISFAIALGVIVPFEFAFKMKNITANQAYSLPIKRERLYLTKFIFGFLEIVVPFTLAYGISVVSLLPIHPYVNMLGFLVFYGLLIVIGLLFYSFEVFVYCQANNVVDGIIFIALASILPFAVAFVVLFDITGTSTVAYPFNPSHFCPEYSFSIADDIAKCVLYHNHVFAVTFTYGYGYHDIIYKSVSYKFTMDAQYIVGICFFVALGIASFIGQFFASKNYKSEDAGQRSESWFGYKLYIPIVIISFSHIIGNASVVFYFICLISAYLLYVLYKRSFKLNKKTWIILACVLIGATVAYVVGFTSQDIIRHNYYNKRYGNYYTEVLFNSISLA
ncbi:hypothetical protein EI71_01060 [Anaeroplasma bactoclasticum]|jgi:hypothetical protein|uniref:ABC transporter permease n=1 Tax=Anaeroplasma bactoclasticum TaxID=2088 RepID=A0A397RW83_9MOLU|nr:hypothetical protein [Anaeroplasma bactoclasticum]RIA75887.1 hypothetical protein EI71_01060 [Anaeroplasma bactoclasticum]